MNYRNLAELHRLQAERFGPLPAVRYRQHGVFQDRTWGAYRADALACAAALIDAGIEWGDRVALLAENRVEWLIADLGILAAGAVNVPPHAPLTARQVQFQLADAGARWVFVSTAQQLQKILAIRAELPELRGIVVFDRQAARGAPDVLTWDGFLQHGRRLVPTRAAELAAREARTGLDDLATVMYTSGTTGNPKGVMLTHGNLLSNAAASLEMSIYRPDDVVLNWLPFSHIYARLVDHYQSLLGPRFLCLAGSAETLVADLQEVEPTHLSCVPRFYEKLLTAVAAPDHKKTGRRLRDIFGRRMRWLTSGGAPLPRPIAEAYASYGLPLYQGYGLTETSPVISFNRPECNKIGTVGLPLPGVQVAIAADGEVLTRGPHVMKGYWNNPAATNEVLRDGWLCTGDLGELDADGFLTITGRKKELLVLSNGKKVVPSFLEGLLVADDCIDQAVVCGEGKSFLTALVVPNWDKVRSALAADGFDFDHQPAETLAEEPSVCALLERRIGEVLRDVACWERVRKFVVLPEPFTVEAEELTVSLKLRRNVVLEKHRTRLEALYADDRPGDEGDE